MKAHWQSGNGRAAHACYGVFVFRTQTANEANLCEITSPTKRVQLLTVLDVAQDMLIDVVPAGGSLMDTVVETISDAQVSRFSRLDLARTSTCIVGSTDTDTGSGIYQRKFHVQFGADAEALFGGGMFPVVAEPGEIIQVMNDGFNLQMLMALAWVEFD